MPGLRPTVITVAWDKTDGASGYSILKNGVVIASTKTALTAKLGVSAGVNVRFEVEPKGVTAPRQRLDVHFEVV